MTILQDFENANSLTISNLVQAEEKTEKAKSTAVEILKSIGGGPDLDIVLFGSLARMEYTQGSDLDWTLLVDGQVDPQHSDIYNSIGGLLEDSKKFTDPSASGLFGQITFSQTLLHNIGGERDSNFNMTLRTLLLLESVYLELNDGKSGTTHSRVVKQILTAYIKHDSSFNGGSGTETKVPRFLLNDFIRLWRTMCVDFAHKQKASSRKKWAMRNIKLRMSRKLIYCKGLLLIYSCYNNEELDSEKPEPFIDHLFKLSKMTPIELFITMANQNKISKKLVKEIVILYDKFISNMSDQNWRDAIINLKMEDAYSEKHFIEARELSHVYQGKIFELFLDEDFEIKKFMTNYAIF